MNKIFEKITDVINKNDVVLFMKGNKETPRCGFSSTVVQILDMLGVDFYDVDVLLDEEIREAIKNFSDWPTIPQLYIKGEFIGGCDITRELYKRGELKKILEN